jgi:pimeloyl-ACP methyl ester carboxylesterase
MTKISSVVLVHGAWADGSSWMKVIPSLIETGLDVVAVQLPLTGFDADVAAVARAIALMEGSVLLVGHSYAGAVIGQAGNDPKVAKLLYVDAFAPDAGESAGALFAKFEAAPLGAEIRPDKDGFLKLSRRGVFELFAQDLSEAEKAVVYATQGPVNAAALGGTLTEAAWRSRPTFYLVGDQDHAIPRAEQERMAARMEASVFHVGSSHVPMLSVPDEVCKVILSVCA